MKYFLRLSSLFICLLTVACGSPYKGLQQQPLAISAYRYQPEFQKVSYRAIVDGKFLFKEFHLSGVLIIKQLQNGTIRAVFQNELGPALFGFEWDEESNFKVLQVMEQLDKEAVIKTLRKDIEMLLMIGLDKDSEILLTEGGGKRQFNRFDIESGYVYYISNDKELSKIENTNNRKRIVTVNVNNKPADNRMPENVSIKHHTANFVITLTKL